MTTEWQCEKCEKPSRTRALAMITPTGTVAVGRYGPECFYVAADSIRGQGHTPIDARTGRTIWRRHRARS